jgi:ABC-type dipeptide/oligopeptide/nickel transport system permease component
MPAADESQAELAAVEELVQKADEVTAKLERKDRSAIAKRVVLLYIATVAACFLFIIGIFWFGTPCNAATTTGCVEWQGPADFLLQVLTTTVLPIVTLVLGYYFGTAKSEGDDT